jgi:predicted AAA+ superfamily ATPase
MAIHAGRIKLLSVDIAFITYLVDNLPNPYIPIKDDIQI